MSQLRRELSTLSSSDDDDIWDPTGKPIEEIRAFLVNWEKECRQKKYARVLNEYKEYKEQVKAKKLRKLQSDGCKYASEEDEGIEE